MDRSRLPDPEIRVDGEAMRVACYLAYAGAYQLTLMTTVLDVAVELHSSYLGHPDGAESVATHLALEPRAAPRTWTKRHPGGELPVGDERQRCLYDHLAQLQELVANVTAGEVTIDVADAAIETVDAA